MFGGNRVIPLSAWEKSDMAVLAEITELLKRWDVWKRVEESPARIDALEKRIAELEKRLQHAPGEACPSCGALNIAWSERSPLLRHSRCWGSDSTT
jgi:hypothetical protein